MTDARPQVRAGRTCAEVLGEPFHPVTPGTPDTARRVLAETTLTRDAACAEVGKHSGGQPVSRRTLAEWMTVGFPLPDGRRVRLDGIKVGARWVTSREAITRFIEALQAS